MIRSRAKTSTIQQTFVFLQACIFKLSAMQCQVDVIKAIALQHRPVCSEVSPAKSVCTELSPIYIIPIQQNKPPVRDMDGERHVFDVKATGTNPKWLYPEESCQRALWERGFLHTLYFIQFRLFFATGIPPTHIYFPVSSYFPMVQCLQPLLRGNLLAVFKKKRGGGLCYQVISILLPV